jgi:hypothetical protein
MIRAPSRTEQPERLFGPVSGKRVAVLGIGGGGDAVSTVPLVLELERLGAVAIPGGLTWKRREHDPERRPRAVHEFRNLRQLAPSVGVGRREMVTVDGVRHVEAHIAQALGDREVLVIDPSQGSAAVLRDLKTASKELGIDLIIGVDVGGDVLCMGHETSLESPLCDQTLLHALAGLNSPLVLASLGTDGEIQPDDFIARFSQLCASSAFLGALDPADDDLDHWEAVLRGANTESSRFAVVVRRGLHPARLAELRARLASEPVSAAQEILARASTLPLRGGGRTGHLSELTAFFLVFDSRAVWESGGFSKFWRPDATIREMHQELVERGIKTEFGGS